MPILLQAWRVGWAKKGGGEGKNRLGEGVEGRVTQNTTTMSFPNRFQVNGSRTPEVLGPTLYKNVITEIVSPL